ncbi:MAG: flagellar basal-body MS-ring/collar protein FliF [Acidimicrobiales bacterium]
MTAPVRPGPQAGGTPGETGQGGLVLRLRDRSKEIVAGFSSGQKTVVVVAVLAVVIGGYLFMSWASQPSYVPLFSNLSSSDAAAITQKLAANKIPYELSEGGQQVLVPDSDVYQQRLDMAAAGLPSSGDQGYSLLDSSGVTTSQFQQQVEYQQAVSDELEQTIESINGVSSAVVNVVIPQESLFSSSADQPSASVLVSLQAGITLTAEQVEAIVHLVASSIEGLTPANVTVADSNGDVLNAPGTDAGNVAAGTIEQQETETYDQSLDDSLQDMLATVLGAGNAVVHASAVLDFDQTQVTSQIYDPDKQGPIPVQQATSKETYTGAGASLAAGVQASSNVPATAATTTTTAPAKSAKNGSSKTTTTVAGSTASAVTTVPSYTQLGSSQQDVVSEVTKSVNSAPGALEQLSLAVVVNSSVKGVNTSEIKQLVTAAAGLQPSRGDTIQVAFVPFDQTAAKLQAAQLKAAASAKSKATMMSEARGGLVLVVVIGLLVFSMRRITKTTRVPLALPPGFQALELESGEAYPEGEEMALALTGPRTSHMAEPMAPAPLQAEVSQIGQMIEREPERIAEMLRAWLEAGPGDK